MVTQWLPSGYPMVTHGYPCRTITINMIFFPTRLMRTLTFDEPWLKASHTDLPKDSPVQNISSLALEYVIKYVFLNALVESDISLCMVRK